MKTVEDSHEEVYDHLEGEGVKLFIPSKVIDLYTRLEILLGLKSIGHSNTLTKASDLTDEIYKRAEIQNEREYQYALTKIYIHKM